MKCPHIFSDLVLLIAMLLTLSFPSIQIVALSLLTRFYICLHRCVRELQRGFVIAFLGFLFGIVYKILKFGNHYYLCNLFELAVIDFNCTNK